jgi:hypothetical protein
VNYVEFVRLVHDMRMAQKDFFDRRTQSSLALAKSLEKRVDKVVLQVLGDQIAVEQGQMFPLIQVGRRR